MNTKITWTLEKVSDGFKKFFKEYRRYPTVLEFDKYPYLPSSRQVQRRWPGGVRQLRKELGLQVTDYTRGNSRATMAITINKRGLDMEREVQKILVNRFGEEFVHEQKMFQEYKGAGRVDFMVYTKTKKFAVDVFYAKDKYSFIGCVNSKNRLYRSLPFEVIFLSINSDLEKQFDMSSLMKNRKTPILGNSKIMNMNQFSSYINNLEPFMAV